MAAYAQDSSFFTRRGIVVVAIIASAHPRRLGIGFRPGSQGRRSRCAAHRGGHRRRSEERRRTAAAAAARNGASAGRGAAAGSVHRPADGNHVRRPSQDVTDKPPPPAPPPPPRVAGTSREDDERGRIPIDYYPPGANAAKSRARRWCRLAWVRTVDWCANPWSPKRPDSRISTVPRSRSPRPTAIRRPLEGGTALPESCIKFKVKFVLKSN